MIWGAFRVGRYAMRASGSRGPSGPPQEWGWLGKSITLLIAGILAVHWWRASLIILGVLLLFIVPCCLAAGSSARARRAAQPDPLAEAMKDYTGKGEL
jgi:hypothetical protein